MKRIVYNLNDNTRKVLKFKMKQLLNEAADAVGRRWARGKYEARTLFEQEQKPRIMEFVENDTFALVILDSCRYDVFADEVGNFLEGDLDYVFTPATYTVQYFRRTWSGRHEDLVYFTGLSAPTDYAFDQRGIDFVPSDHIGEFIHVWNRCESKELGAVPPEEMTEIVLREKARKMVVHYVQPHAPYIGDYRLRETSGQDWEESLEDIYERIGRYGGEQKTISDDKLRRAYRSNLQRALASVRDLVKSLDRPVVVTADHGEMLGEDGRYIHGGNPREELCKVPWFKVDSSMLGDENTMRSREHRDSGDGFDTSDIRQQLEDLGYV